jgi:hypothetical protein
MTTVSVRRPPRPAPVRRRRGHTMAAAPERPATEHPVAAGPATPRPAAAGLRGWVHAALCPATAGAAARPEEAARPGEAARPDEEAAR